MNCKHCGSTELVYDQKVMDDYCQSCGKWQDGELPYKCTGSEEFPTWDAESFIGHLQKEHDERET